MSLHCKERDLNLIRFLVVLIGTIILVINYKKKRFLSSVTFWVLIYLLILVVFPLVSDLAPFDNESLIDTLSLIGIVCFFLGTVIGDKIRIKQKGLSEYFHKQLIPDYNISKMWFVFALFLSAVALIYLLGTEGIKSIILGDSTSKDFILHSDRSSSIYVFSVHLQVPSILALRMSASTKNERRFSYFAIILYLVETVLFGFTRIFLITILTIVFVYEVRNMTVNKQLVLFIVSVSLLVLLLISLNFIRSLGLGRVDDFWGYLDLSYVLESTDFGASYKWFDKLLNQQSPLINPIVYLKPLFVLIPRSIWPSKPEPLSLQILRYIDPDLASTGYSTAGNSVLGEGYAVLDWLGLILYPLLWGIVCSSLDRNYYNRLNNKEKTSLNDICYYIFAVFIVISGQRGDWSQYMGIVLWLYYLPLFVMSKFTVRKAITVRNTRNK